MENKPEITLNKTDNIYSKENSKLSKNSRGVTWEIRVVAEKDKLTQEDLDRLEALHKDFLERYEGQDNQDKQDKGEKEF